VALSRQVQGRKLFAQRLAQQRNIIIATTICMHNEEVIFVRTIHGEDFTRSQERRHLECLVVGEGSFVHGSDYS
jgi:hypothetical protein